MSTFSRATEEEIGKLLAKLEALPQIRLAAFGVLANNVSESWTDAVCWKAVRVSTPKEIFRQKLGRNPLPFSPVAFADDRGSWESLFWNEHFDNPKIAADTYESEQQAFLNDFDQLAAHFFSLHRDVDGKADSGAALRARLVEWLFAKLNPPVERLPEPEKLPDGSEPHWVVRCLRKPLAGEIRRGLELQTALQESGALRDVWEALRAKDAAVSFETKPTSERDAKQDAVDRKAASKGIELYREHGQQAKPDPLPTRTPEPEKLQPFGGGEMVFFPGRVELCGVTICSDGRPKWMREVLSVLREQRTDSSFVAFGGAMLAERIGAEEKDVARVIRDVRDSITESLQGVNITCGRHDVIQSGGPGYRIAASLTVQDAGRYAAKPITDIAEPITDIAEPITDIGDTDEPANVPNDDVLDVRDDAARVRRAWILQQLADGKRLKATAVVDQFKCSKKTALRDLAALKDDGKIEFVGDARTGYYRLYQVPDASQ